MYILLVYCVHLACKKKMRCFTPSLSLPSLRIFKIFLFLLEFFWEMRDVQSLLFLFLFSSSSPCAVLNKNSNYLLVLKNASTLKSWKQYPKNFRICVRMKGCYIFFFSFIVGGIVESEIFHYIRFISYILSQRLRQNETNVTRAKDEK